MRCFLLLIAFGVVTFAAPQEYGYKQPTPVLSKNGFQPITPFRSLPCLHAAHHTSDAASALIESQSTARIVNHQKHYSADHNFVTAASGYSPQSQLSTVKGSIDGKGPSQAVPAMLGYAPNGAQLPHNIQAQVFNTQSVGSAQHGASSYNQGYNYNHAVSSHGQNYVVQHNQHNFPVAPISVQPYDSVFTGSQNGVSGYVGSFDHNGHLATQTASSTAAHTIQHTANAGSALNFGAVGSLNGQLGHVIQETFAKAPLDPSAEKHIYVHVPPEDIEDANNQLSVTHQQLPAIPKKHYKIIFIKAPSAPAPNYSQLAAAVPQTEEKTLVYVLVKKPDEPSLEEIQQIQQSSYKSNKPEVYFIKYKTRKQNESGQYSSNLPIPTEVIEQQQNTGGVTLIKDTSDFIDIRSGGESSSTSTSTSYTSSTGPINDGPKHELYGVPLN